MEYQALLEKFRKGPEELERAVKGITKELADYRPFPEAWSIRELVVHVTDSEINNFIRWKSIIAQPRSNAFVIDEDAWVRNMEYTTASIEKYLMVFRLLREISYEYLIEVDQKEWNNEYFLHPTLGMVTLEKCISMYANHIPSHIEHIERNKKLWAERG
jgi:hypothetical protein